MNISFHVTINNSKWFYSSMFPIKEIIREYMRPWKLCILTVGMAWLFYGALNWDYSDWDIGVSIIMGLLAYLLAPWSVSTFIKCVRYKPPYWFAYIILCLLCEVFTVDTSYVLWHTYAGNTMIRYGNFLASSYLYLAAGFIWLYKGSLKDLYYDLKHNVKITKNQRLKNE
jgi:hypothetical protein